MRSIIAEAPSTSVVGIRINPVVGAGAVANLSVATRSSKFGVVLGSEGTEERANLVEALVEADFITCVHVHTGECLGGASQFTLASFRPPRAPAPLLRQPRAAPRHSHHPDVP